MSSESVFECVLDPVRGDVGYRYNRAAGLTGHSSDEETYCSSLLIF